MGFAIGGLSRQVAGIVVLPLKPPSGLPAELASLVKATFKNARFDFAAEGLRCEIDVMLGGMEPAEAARQEPLALDRSDT